jgi:hypothetical protein
MRSSHQYGRSRLSRTIAERVPKPLHFAVIGPRARSSLSRSSTPGVIASRFDNRAYWEFVTDICHPHPKPGTDGSIRPVGWYRQAALHPPVRIRSPAQAAHQVAGIAPVRIGHAASCMARTRACSIFSAAAEVGWSHIEQGSTGNSATPLAALFAGTSRTTTPATSPRRPSRWMTPMKPMASATFPARRGRGSA